VAVAGWQWHRWKEGVNAVILAQKSAPGAHCGIGSRPKTPFFHHFLIIFWCVKNPN
jgi:hypothetical protein